MIHLDRVSFDALSGARGNTRRRRNLRYGGEKQIRVQTTRFSVSVSSQPWGKRMSLKDCTSGDGFLAFLKHIETIGGGEYVDDQKHPLEHLYLTEDTQVFDERGVYIQDVDEVVFPGASMEVTCIVALDGMIFTSDPDGTLLSARLNARVEQVKIHSIRDQPVPKVYVNGRPLSGHGEHDAIANAAARN